MFRSNKNENDVNYILDNLMEEDLAELKALFGEDWKQKTLDRIMGTNFYVMLGKTKNKGVPVCMGGIEQAEDDVEGVGCAWFLCTNEIKKHAICILRELKAEIEKADEKFWLTYNFIHKGHNFAKRWLKWLGYKFDKTDVKGLDIPEGFELFYRIRPVKGLGE